MKAKKQKTFAQRAERIMKKYEARPDDTAAQDSKNRELAVLKQEQEMYKQNKAMEAMETIQSMGYGDMLASNEPQQGPPQPSQEEMMATQQQQAMMQQQGQGMAAYGGNINRYETGGDLEPDPTDPPYSIYDNTKASLDSLNTMAELDYNFGSKSLNTFPNPFGTTTPAKIKAEKEKEDYKSKLSKELREYYDSNVKKTKASGYREYPIDVEYHGGEYLGNGEFSHKSTQFDKLTGKPKLTKAEKAAVNKVLPKWMQHAYGGNINRYAPGGDLKPESTDSSKSCPTGYYWSSIKNKCVSKEELKSIYHDMGYTDRNSSGGVYEYHPEKLEEGYDGGEPESGSIFNRTIRHPNITHNSRMKQAYSDYMKSDPGFMEEMGESMYHIGSQSVGAIKSMFGLNDDSVGEAINKPKSKAYGGHMNKYALGGEFEAESVNPWITAGQLAPDVYGLAQNLRPADEFTSKKMDSNIYTDTSAEEAAIDRATGSAGAGLRENLRLLGSAGGKSAAVTGAAQIATGAGAKKAELISSANQLDDRTNLSIEAQNNALINADAKFNMESEGARRTATEQYLRNIGQETVPGIALDQTQNEMQAAIIKALGSGDYAYEGGIQDLILAFQGGQTKKGE